MICEFCERNEATVHLKQVCNGDVREMDICADCARERGFDVQSPLSMTDFLFGMGGPPKAREEEREKACGSCHMRTSDFKKSSRLGCPSCYEHFAEELAPMLKSMHKAVRHVGKTPVHERIEGDIHLLRDELQKCIAGQDFERAAVLRDRIKALSARGAALRSPVS